MGHADWRAEHVRVEHGRVSAVYDWDSLTVAPRAGGGRRRRLTPSRRTGRSSAGSSSPSLEEALAFVSEYESARGAPFDGDARAVAQASLAYAMAYTARCEHSDALTDMGRREPAQPSSPDLPPHTARAFLAAHAAELLGRRVSAA